MYVWCTYASDAHLAQALVFHNMMKYTKTKYEIWCIVSGQYQNILAEYYDKVITVDKLLLNGEDLTKLLVFSPSLFPAKKVIYCDPSVHFNENCDYLFSIETPAVIYGGFGYKPNNPFSKYNQGEIISRALLLKNIKSGVIAQSCIFSIEPSKYRSAILRKLINENVVSKYIEKYNSGPPRLHKKHRDSTELCLSLILLCDGRPVRQLLSEDINYIGGYKDHCPKIVYLPKNIKFPTVSSRSERNLVLRYNACDEVRNWWTHAANIIDDSPGLEKYFYV